MPSQLQKRVVSSFCPPKDLLRPGVAIVFICFAACQAKPLGGRNRLRHLAASRVCNQVGQAVPPAWEFSCNSSDNSSIGSAVFIRCCRRAIINPRMSRPRISALIGVAFAVASYYLWEVRATGNQFYWGLDLDAYYDHLGRAL